jgi:hypothetical protein
VTSGAVAATSILSERQAAQHRLDPSPAAQFIIFRRSLRNAVTFLQRHVAARLRKLKVMNAMPGRRVARLLCCPSAAAALAPRQAANDTITKPAVKMDVGLLSDMASCPLAASPCTTNILEIAE